MGQSRKGCLVTLEGGEGAGKSVLQRKLSDYLLNQGIEVISTREPGGCPLSEKIRDLLLKKEQSFDVGAKAELLLFLAARAQHIEELILPALEAGKVVLCDRFNDSTIAYQGGARGLGVSYVKNLCQMVCGPVWPQLTLLLDIDPQIGLKRALKTHKKHAERGQWDRIESEQLSFHEKIRDSLLLLCQDEPHRFFCIDASQSEEAVFKEALLALKNFTLS